jgi:hypothetical protein
MLIYKQLACRLTAIALTVLLLQQLRVLVSALLTHAVRALKLTKRLHTMHYIQMLTVYTRVCAPEVGGTHCRATAGQHVVNHHVSTGEVLYCCMPGCARMHAQRVCMTASHLCSSVQGAKSWCDSAQFDS